MKVRDKKHLAREDDDDDDGEFGGGGESGEGGEGCGIKWKHAATAAMATAARSKLRRRGEERRGEGRFAVDGATTAKIARFDAAARRFDHRENQVLEAAC